MKKSTMRWWVVLAVVFVVYNVVAFALPFEKTAVFAESYLFSLIAIAAQIYVVKTAFCQRETVKSKFYGFPIAKIGVMYLAAQLILGLVFMALSAVIPMWLPLILYVVMLGAAAVGLIAADAMRDEIDRQDVKLKKDVSAMRALQSRANVLASRCEDAALRKAVQAFAEDLRFSDPVSSDALREPEAELARCVTELECAVVDGDVPGALALCRKAEALLAERNRLCRLNK